MLALVNQRPQLLNIYQDTRGHHISGNTTWSTYISIQDTLQSVVVINQD